MYLHCNHCAPHPLVYHVVEEEDVVITLKGEEYPVASTSVASTLLLYQWEIVPSLLQLVTGKRKNQPSHTTLTPSQGRSAD